MVWFAFKAGDEYLGIEAQYIHRVVDEVKVTPVPLVPDCHRGLMYYRGEVFDVIHIGSLLGQREAVYPPASPESSRPACHCEARPPGKRSEADRARAGRWRAGDENPRIILLKWSSKKLALAPDHIIGLVSVEDNKRGQTVYAPSPAERDDGGQKEKYVVRLIAPDHIWEKVSELSYGPHKV